MLGQLYQHSRVHVHCFEDSSGAAMRFTRKLLTTGLFASTVLSGVAFAQESQIESQVQDPAPVEDVVEAVEPSEETEEIVVRGRFIPNVKRTTSEVVSVLTAEDFVAQGDSDIAEALTRVTGLSLVGDGFVYVRGLGDRYSSVTLDGASVPSPQVLRRVVPLNLFPTALLSGAVVQKTHSSNLPLQFAGGVVQLSTKAVPSSAFFSFGGSVAYNGVSTFERSLGFDAGGLEILGFHRGALSLPAEIAVDPSLAFQTSDPTGLTLEAAGEALRPNASIDRFTAGPDVDVNFSGGLPFKIGGFDAGIFIAVDYDSGVRNDFGERSQFQIGTDGLEPLNPATREFCTSNPAFASGVDPRSCGLFRSDFVVQLNALGNFGIEFGPNHEVKYTSMLLRQSTRQAQLLRGAADQDDNVVTSQQLLNFVEEQLWFNQLAGTHRFDLTGPFVGFQIDWRGSYSNSTRETPNRREVTFEFDPTSPFNPPSGNQFRIEDTFEDSSTTFTSLEDDNFDVGLDFTLDGNVLEREFTVKAGAAYLNRSRDFATRVFRFALPPGVGLSQIEQSLGFFVPEIIFSPDNIGPGGFRLVDDTDAFQNFSADLEIWSGYLQAEAQILSNLRLTAGARYETSRQTVDTFEGPPASTAIPVFVSQAGNFLLPSATLTWEFADNMQLRAGFSQTISRPDLRELAEAPFLNEADGFVELGNSELEITRINNFDVRWEWYFGPKQIVTVGAFYKELDRPIEFAVPGGIDGFGVLRQFANADRAELLGFEAEFELTLPQPTFFKNIPALASRRFYLNANGTYVNSVVNRPQSIPGVPTAISPESLTGPLTGQSRWLGNAQLGFENESVGERAAILANYTSERVFGLGTAGLPDIIETPPLLLDFVYNRAFSVAGQEVTMQFKVENILGDEFLLSQGGRRFESYELGRTVTLGASVRF